MTTDLDTRKLLSMWDEALDPSAPLDPMTTEGARRYVAVDRWVAADGQIHHLRGPSDLVGELASDIEIAALKPSPRSTQLLAGFRGTGKSTELNRLGAALSKKTYAVLAFDVHEYLLLNAAPTQEQLGLAIAAGVAERAAEELALEAFKQRSIWQRVREFMSQDVPQVELTLPLSGATVKAVLRESPDFADQLKALLAKRPNRLKEFVHGILEEVADAIAPQQLVILVDGLDKYTVPREQVVVVYRAMADLFFQEVELLRLPRCHVVYVIPPYLGFLNKGLAEAYGGRLRILPSIKVRERPSRSQAPGGDPYEPGVRCLEQLASRRVDLDRLFGPDRRQAIDLLALASGGHVRDLFNLLREVLRRALSLGLPVPFGSIQGAVDALSQDRSGLFRPTVELLEAVRKSENLAALDDAQMGALAGAMDEYLVLAYRNGDPWFGVHPLIIPLLDQALAALQRLGATAQSEPR